MGATERPRRKREQQTEGAEVKPQYQTVSNQDTGRNERRQATVVQHGLVDPVAIAGKPEDAHEISSEGSAQQGLGVAQIVPREQSVEQRHKG